MAVRYWLTRPRALAARVRYWRWERRNPGAPWLCPGTVAFCQAHLTPAMRALEFGSGRSTRWFADRVGHLTSVEHEAQWHGQVARQLAAAGVTNVTYLLVPLNHPEAAAEREVYEPTPDYVAVADRVADASLGFAVVDGHYRTACVKHLVPKVAPGGYLLVDDINLWPSLAALPVPAGWRVADDSTNGLKRCVVWRAG